MEKIDVSEESLYVRTLYKVTLLFGVLGPFMNIPQILKIFMEQTAAGVSLLAWCLYMVFDMPFILWGIYRKDTPIVTTYSLWMLTNLGVVIGIIIYG